MSGRAGDGEGRGEEGRGAGGAGVVPFAAGRRPPPLPPAPPAEPAPAYAELAATSNFSFLRGASHPGELVRRALALGHAGLGLADENSVAGVVRAFAAWRDARDAAAAEGRPFAFTLAVGARLVFADGAPDVLAYPESRAGWARLCRLLTEGNRRAKKGDCELSLDDLLADTAHLLLAVMPPRRPEDAAGPLARLAEAAPGAVWLAAQMRRQGDDRRRLARLAAVAAAAGVPLLAVNDVLYAAPADRDLQDVLTCIREGTTVEAAGRRLEANAERHLKSPAEMARLFRDAPEAIAETAAFLARVRFSLGELRYEYPDEPVPPGWAPQAWLAELVRRRAAVRYPAGVPAKVAGLLAAELALIETLGYACYFLTIHDIVRFAEERGILCQGRGSAANSAVCYVLGITAVDPAEHELLFARFLSEERREPPDIDVDFEHERREEVIQHIYARYGRHRAGLVATVIRYRPRSAIRDVGKALGLTADVTARIAGTVWGSWGREIPGSQVREAGLDPENPVVARAVAFAERLMGFPRHLSQHVGGFVLARGRLDDLVPIGNAAMAERTCIEWDKDDIDVLGLMKVDVLALGMLTCIRKAFDLMRAHAGVDMALADVPADQADVYAMLQRGDSVGVFQVESRAQMNMLPRLRPARFYDLVIQVAIVRPGPIQGDMVHPYLRRRQGLEKADLPGPAPAHGPADELQAVLGRTLGVPLFQEQAMQLAMTAAHFTDVEANQLRRAMATFRHVGTIHTFERKLVGRMVARGYARGFAERCFQQIKGFGEYGFPESHAASFAKLVYVSAYIKCRHPAVFACALLNSQPMGFYAPAQIVRDAREHGVEVRPVDVNASRFDNTLEQRADGALALRLGLRQVDGFATEWADRLVAARGAGYAAVEEIAARARLPARAMRALADADGLGSLGLGRREGLWAVRRLPDDAALPLFAAADARELAAEPDARLPEMPLGEHVATDYQMLRLSLKAHPMQVLRPVFRRDGILSAAEAAALNDGARVRVAGAVLIRQRPGKGNVVFMTLEDETGIANVVIWARLLERHRAAVMAARLIEIAGRLQKSPEGIVHVVAERITDRTAELARLTAGEGESGEGGTAREVREGGKATDGGRTPSGAVTPPPSPPGDFAGQPAPRGPRHPRDVRVLPKSRDFH